MKELAHALTDRTPERLNHLNTLLKRGIKEIAGDHPKEYTDDLLLKLKNSISNYKLATKSPLH